MKLRNPVVAHQAGTVTGLWAVPGDGTTQDQVLWELI
jgi:biotin carboxyl carrier protein